MLCSPSLGLGVSLISAIYYSQKQYITLVDSKAQPCFAANWSHFKASRTLGSEGGSWLLFPPGSPDTTVHRNPPSLFDDVYAFNFTGLRCDEINRPHQNPHFCSGPGFHPHSPEERPGIVEEVSVGSLGCARGLSAKGCPMLCLVRDALGSAQPPAWGQILKAGQAYAGMNAEVVL